MPQVPFLYTTQAIIAHGGTKPEFRRGTEREDPGAGILRLQCSRIV